MNEFNYEKMTPELEAYFAHGEKCPRYEYPKGEDGKVTSWDPTPESKAARGAWDKKQTALRAQLPEGEPAAFYKAQKLWFCRDDSQCGEPTEHASPSGKYRLVVTSHQTREGGWNYSKGRVYVGDTLIETVCRNYGAFPFAWVEGHAKTGHDYLVCGEDYQGQTVINLVTGQRVDHLPTSASEGVGFCWASIHPNPSGTLLAVCGCYWACPYQTIIVDFENPMDPPWLVLARDDEDAFDGWTDDGTCKIGTRYEVVDIEGHPLHGKKEGDCTLEDLEEIERYAAEHGLEGKDGSEPGWKEVLDTHVWSRPSATDMLRTWLRVDVPWRQKKGYEVVSDIAIQLALLAWRAAQEGGDLKNLLADDPELRALLEWAAVEGQKEMNKDYGSQSDDWKNSRDGQRFAEHLEVLRRIQPLPAATAA